MAVLYGSWWYKVIFLLLLFSTRHHAVLAQVSLNCGDISDPPLNCGMEITCTCTVDDDGGRSTLWNGSAIIPGSCSGGITNGILFSHIGFNTIPPISCNDGAIVGRILRMSGITFNTEVTIITKKSMNGTNIGCTRTPLMLNNTVELLVGEKPQPVQEGTLLLSVPVNQTIPRSFSLKWPHTLGASYIITIESDSPLAPCADYDNVTVDNSVAVFNNWTASGQRCTFSVITVSGDNCVIESDPSSSVSILLQGPEPLIVDSLMTNGTIYDASSGKLVSVNVIVSYTPQNETMIVDGLPSSASGFRISANGCIVTVTICGQPQCVYPLHLSDCQLVRSDDINISVAPINPVAIGNETKSMINGTNRIFSVSAPSGTVISPNVTVTLMPISYTCQVVYGLGGNCGNLTMAANFRIEDNVLSSTFTVTKGGRYCYRIACNVNGLSVNAQGTFLYSPESPITTTDTDVPTAPPPPGFPWWIIVIIIIVLIIITIVVVIILCIRYRKMKMAKKMAKSTIEMESTDGNNSALIEHEKAPGGEEYAIVTQKPGNPPQNSNPDSFYQDPGTIQHETAPVTGDVYAVADKKTKESPVDVAYSVPDKSRKNQGITYADVDVAATRGGDKPLQQLLQTEYATFVN